MKMTLFKRTWTRIRWYFRTRRSAIALTVLAFNLVGNGLRDALDVRSRE